MKHEQKKKLAKHCCDAPQDFCPLFGWKHKLDSHGWWTTFALNEIATECGGKFLRHRCGSPQTAADAAWLPMASIQTSPWAKWANGVVLVWWTSTCMENTPYTRCSNEILLPLSRNSDACLMRQQQRQRLLSGPLNFSAGRFWLLTWQIDCLFDFLLACTVYCTSTMSYFTSFFPTICCVAEDTFLFGRQKKFLF